MANTFTEAVEVFLSEADWLRGIEEPAVTALRQAARSLDEAFYSSTLAQYRLLYNDLIRTRPPDVEKEDEDPDLKELG